jgi:hypothetical protein
MRGYGSPVEHLLLTPDSIVRSRRRQLSLSPLSQRGASNLSPGSSDGGPDDSSTVSTASSSNSSLDDWFILVERICLAAEFMLSVFEDAYTQSVEYVYSDVIPKLPPVWQRIFPPEACFTNPFCRVVLPGVWFSVVFFSFSYHVFLVWNRACNIDFLTSASWPAQISQDDDPIQQLPSFLILCILLIFVTALMIMVDFALGGAVVIYV